LPAHLPRERVVIPAPSVCPCCQGKLVSLAEHYSHTGRPSIDHELMIRMLLVGYLYGIRSETRLCEEVHLNLAYRWFCRLGLDADVPERSTFSKNPGHH
jgi:transposase